MGGFPVSWRLKATECLTQPYLIWSSNFFSDSLWHLQLHMSSIHQCKDCSNQTDFETRTVKTINFGHSAAENWWKHMKTTIFWVKTPDMSPPTQLVWTEFIQFQHKIIVGRKLKWRLNNKLDRELHMGNFNHCNYAFQPLLMQDSCPMWWIFHVGL